MLKKLIEKWRMAKAVKRWNASEAFIREQIKDERDDFKWGQLVWQEIWMWIALGKQVTVEEFDIITVRRGFNVVQCKFLRDMMVHVGLGKQLLRIAYVGTATNS